MIVGLGNYTGGEILVEGKPYPIRYTALEFDGWNQLHWTSPFKGERYSLVWFTPEVSSPKNNAKQVSEEKLSSSSNLDDDHAMRLAQEHSKAVPLLPMLTFRPYSTDALVINELLNSEKGSVYSMIPNAKMPAGFSLENHGCVLDVGAHIGVFSRYMIEKGCQRIIAYEPEPSNFELLKRNLDMVSAQTSSTTATPIPPTVELRSSAIAHGPSESRILVQARNENNGKENTWRHSLEEYSQYVDRTTEMSSTLQKQTLQRFSVPSIQLFGSTTINNDGKEEKVQGAIERGVTFVKLDCEGAEVDILTSKEAAQRSSWLDVTHLVVEWSFTKERRVKVFHKAMSNLREAGFEVYYEGIGSWWDTDETVMWPYPNDLIIFATK